MKRVSLLSLLVLLISLPAAAQTPAPLITSVRPAAGPTSGGTLVVITGTNLGLPPNFSCILPCPAMVRFGSAEVPAIEESNTSLTVRTGDNRTTTAPGAFTYITDREAGYTTARRHTNLCRRLLPQRAGHLFDGGFAALFFRDLLILTAAARGDLADEPEVAALDQAGCALLGADSLPPSG